MPTVAEVLKEIEEEQALRKIEIYRNFVYQPERLSCSSQNAIIAQSDFNTQTNNSYSNFTINLPRPIINAKSIQLLRASIPQCSQSISDSACVFYYYRLPTQLDINGDTYYTELPNINNLYMIRLLPSYYKQELINNASIYGYNQTFNSYEDLLTQLNLATQNDLAYNNQVSKTMPFIPNDISFSLSSNNKFSFTGNNVNISLVIYPDFNISYYYQQNNIVSYLGNNYICLVDNTNNVFPTVISNWSIYIQTSNFNTYLSAGYLDPNVLTLQQYQYNLTWNQYTFYNTDDIVYYNGNRYQATQPNQNQNPEPIGVISHIYWNLLGNTNPIIALGINGLSQTFDFELLTDIPGQPYYQTVQNRTLNLIMGFTWNGLYFTINQLITPTSYVEGSSAPNLLNRLRPIPIYSSSMGGLLGSYPQTTTGTYTADGYCNLVFSSICSIYTSIVGSSTLDTQRNNNLLSIIPMNCPNLGVSFYNNVINTELTKINSDIYSIYIELRAEDQTPYLISNNGVITIDLKITY